MPIYQSLVGQKFGELEVIARDSNKNRTYFVCACSCGNRVSVREDKLKNGQAISCGCRRRKRSDATHDMSRTRLYHVFEAMRQRCGNPRAQEYKNYGGRGIKVCEEWRGTGGFQRFYDWAMRNGYDENAPYGSCTLDRIDVNGDYTPENCRWVTSKEQAKNTTRNIIIEYGGEARCLKEWSEVTGLSYAAIAKRYRSGWPVAEILGYEPHHREEKK